MIKLNIGRVDLVITSGSLSAIARHKAENKEGSRGKVRLSCNVSVTC